GIIDDMAGASVLNMHRPAEGEMYYRAETVVHVLIAEAQTGPPQVGVEEEGLQAELHLGLVVFLGEEAAPDPFGPVHLRQQLPGYLQTPAVHLTDLVAPGAAADEGLQILLEELLGGTAAAEELAEVAEGYLALAVTAEGIALTDGVAPAGQQFTAVALIQMLVGLIEHQHPAVTGQF